MSVKCLFIMILKRFFMSRKYDRMKRYFPPLKCGSELYYKRLRNFPMTQKKQEMSLTLSCFFHLFHNHCFIIVFFCPIINQVKIIFFVQTLFLM